MSNYDLNRAQLTAMEDNIVGNTILRSEMDL